MPTPEKGRTGFPGDKANLKQPSTQRMIMERKKTMDVSQVARRLNVSRSTVYRLIDQGILPASRLGTAYCIRVLEEDVERYRQERYATSD
jgi:excisionase family DNA binding protein